MRKKLALVLAATMAISVFAMGCGSSEEGNNETTTKAAQTTTATPETTTATPETTTAPEEDTTETPDVSGPVETFGVETKDAAWWTAFSSYYKYTGDFKAIFEIKVDGGASNWQSFVTAITTTERDAEGYSEYAVVRPDNWGWGGGDNKSIGGNDIVYTKSFESFDGLTPSFAETANQGVITLTIERVGSTITLTYDIVGNNGTTYQTTAAVTDNFADDLVFFFCADGSYCTINSVK